MASGGGAGAGVVLPFAFFVGFFAGLSLAIFPESAEGVVDIPGVATGAVPEVWARTLNGSASAEAIARTRNLVITHSRSSRGNTPRYERETRPMPMNAR